MDWYQNILQELINADCVDTSRGKALTKIGKILTFDVTNELPVTTARKIYVGQALIELYCFLKGYNTKAQFNAHKLTWWDKEFTKAQTNTLGNRYGAAWNDFGNVNQIKHAINLLKVNKNTRSAIVYSQSKAKYNDELSIPCITHWQVNILHDCLYLSVYQRSADVLIGLPYDVIEYSVLAKLLQNQFKCTKAILSYHLSNYHLYLDYYSQANTLIAANTYKHPQYKTDNIIDTYNYSQVHIESYKTNGALQLDLKLKQ